MGISTSTGTLTAGQSRTFNLSPASAVTLTLSPNVRVTITETPATVAATGLGGNASRVHEPRLLGTFTYGPYPMGGTVVVDVESNSGSSVAWVRSDSIVAESADGSSSLVDGGGNSFIGPGAYSAAVPLTSFALNMGTKSVTGAIAFTTAAGATLGASTSVRLIADGVNIPTFSGMYRMGGSLDYLNDDLAVNLIQFYFDGDFTWYTITSGSALKSFTPIAVAISASVNVTDEGGGVYAGTASAASSSGRVLLSGSVVVGNRAWIEAEFPAGGDAAWSLGFDANNTVSTVLSNCDACLQVTTAGLMQTAANGAPASTGQSLVAGAGIKARLYLAPSGVVTAEKSADGGATWTVVATIATLTGTVYPYMYATYSATPRRIYQPKQYGFTS